LILPVAGRGIFRPHLQELFRRIFLRVVTEFQNDPSAVLAGH
jgi:hypothetical protein